MTDSEFKKLLGEPSNLKGGFLFFGEEELIRIRYTELFAKAVCGDDEFSKITLEGDKTTPGEFEASLCSVPMMWEKNFVHLRSAPVGSWKENVLEEYLSIFERSRDYTQTVYLISVDDSTAFGDVSRNRASKLYEKMCKYLTPVIFDRKSASQLRRWVERHFQSENIPVSPDAAETLVSYSGNDMLILSSECEKLIAYSKFHGGCEVTADTVYRVSCPDLTEEAFAFSNAVLSGNKASALDSLAKAKARREEPIVLLSSVSRVMCDMLAISNCLAEGMNKSEISKKLKMHEYKVGLYIRALPKDREIIITNLKRCLDTDITMKSTGSAGYIPLERLICS